MGLDGSPVSHQQRLQTMSKRLEFLSIHLICKDDGSTDLQVYYGIMSADPQCIYTLMSPEAKVPEDVLLLLSQRMWK